MNKEDTIIGEFFDNCARDGFMAEFDEKERIKLDSLFSIMQIEKSIRIFEPGCGTGRLSEVLAETVGESGAVVSCDLSSVMIDKARSRKLPDNVEFYCGSAHECPAKDAYFDMVFAFQVYPHFSDREATLAEFKRILKPGGDLWIAHLASRQTINDRHHEAGGPVISHKIPTRDEMNADLSAFSFELLDMKDSDYYWLHARKQD